VAEILASRAERARLLGFKDVRGLPRSNSPWEDPDNVRKLLMEVWGRRALRAGEERGQLQAAQAEAATSSFGAWDWRYYAEKVRKTKSISTTGRSSPTCSSTGHRRRLRRAASCSA